MQDVSAQLAKSRTILLGLPINDQSSTEVVAKMLFLKSINPHLAIQLILNSPGGSVTAGLAVLETMNQLRLPIHTHCLGFCGGMAAMILAHGTPGMRSASPEARIALCRTYVGNTSGTTPDQINCQIEKMTQTLVLTMARDTGLAVSQVRSDMESERNFTACEAAAYGIIDRVAAPTIVSL